MPLLSQNESNFEFALRLTRALKYAENEGVMRSNAQGMYIDSKTVLDVLYAEVTATEGDWDSPYTLTDQGLIALEDDAEQIPYEPYVIGRQYLQSFSKDNVSEIQRASVSERSYHPHIPFEHIGPSIPTSEIKFEIPDGLSDELLNQSTPGHSKWFNCDCVYWSHHQDALRVTKPTHVQSTISKAFAPCGKTNNYPE